MIRIQKYSTLVYGDFRKPGVPFNGRVIRIQLWWRHWRTAYRWVWTATQRQGE